MRPWRELPYRNLVLLVRLGSKVVLKKSLVNITHPDEQERFEDVAIIIPAFRAGETLAQVVHKVFDYCRLVIVVSDACPDFCEENLEVLSREKVIVIRNSTNLGVGGSFLRGANLALKEGAMILVKVDSDDQMDPELIPIIIRKIRRGSDFVKGNRYMKIRHLNEIPVFRRYSQILQSIIFKLITGQTKVFDVVNGYFAITSTALREMDQKKLSSGYFFETDLLLQLTEMDKRISEFYTRPRYFPDDRSSLRIYKELPMFLVKNIRRYFAVKFLRYFVRDFNLGSILLILIAINMSLLMLFIIWIAYRNFELFSGATVGESAAFFALSSSLAQLIIAFLIFDNVRK